MIEPDAAPVGGAPAMAYGGEAEPDDTISSAQPVVFPAGGTAVGIAARPVVGGKDVDVFRMAVPAGPRRRLSADVYPDANLAVAVEALGAKEDSLAASTGAAAGEHDGMPNVVVEGGGGVVIRVKATGTGAYKLVLALAALEPGDEIEPNGKAAQANDAALPDEKSGFLGWRRDEDWYRVPLDRLPDGYALWAEMDGPPGVGSALAIHDAAGNKLAERAARKPGRLSLHGVMPRADDRSAFVVVRAATGRNLDGRYVLRIGSEVAKPKAPDAAVDARRPGDGGVQ